MQNLQQLFSNPASPSLLKTYSLLEGQITLFRRPNSANWQYRFKLANGQWHAASTNTEDFDLAQTQAIAIYETVKVKIGGCCDAIVINQPLEIVRPAPPINAAAPRRAAIAIEYECLRVFNADHLPYEYRLIVGSEQRKIMSNCDND